MTEFEDRVSAVLAELRSHSAIDVKMLEEGSLATWLTGPEYALDTIRAAAGVDFDPGIGRNFHRFDGLGCYWSATEEPSISGEFWLTNLVYVCVSTVPEDLSDAQWPVSRRRENRWDEVYGPLITPEDAEDDEGEYLERTICSFDGQGQRGTGAVAGFAEGIEENDPFTIDTASGHPEIWFAVNTDASLVRLDLTYPEYLDAMLLTRGLIHWPYLYADPNDPGFGHAQADLRRHVDFLARTFPRDDFSNLSTRAETLARARDQP